MFEIRHVKVGSVARSVTLITTTLYLLIGAIIVLLAFGLNTVLSLESFFSGFNPISLLMVWLAGTLGILIVSFLTGLLIGALYNVFAGWWGGVRVELGREEDTKKDS